jgi:hypothetical protein
MTYLVARRISASTLYLGRLRFVADGSIRLQVFKVVNGTATAIGTEKTVAGLTYTAGSTIQLRMQVTGTNSSTLKLKAWAAEQAEPTTWLVSVTDSEPSLQTAGAVGLRTFVSSTSTNAPITFTFDDFRVTNPATP